MCIRDRTKVHTLVKLQQVLRWHEFRYDLIAIYMLFEHLLNSQLNIFSQTVEEQIIVSSRTKCHFAHELSFDKLETIWHFLSYNSNRCNFIICHTSSFFIISTLENPAWNLNKRQKYIYVWSYEYTHIISWTLKPGWARARDQIPNDGLLDRNQIPSVFPFPK